MSLVVVALFVALLWQFVLILVPYALSAFIAFLIRPLVNALASRLPGRRTRPRVVRAVTAGVATLVVLVIFAAVIAAGLFQLVQGSAALAERIPELVRELQLTMVLIEQTYRERVPVDIQAQIDPRLEAVGAVIIAAASDAAVQVFGILRSGLSLVIALAGAPIILFYLLYDAPAIGRGIRALLPGPLRNDVCNIGGLAGSTVIAYLRTQLLMGIMVGVVIGLAMWAMGVPAAIAPGRSRRAGGVSPRRGSDIGFRRGRNRNPGYESRLVAHRRARVPGRTVAAKHAGCAPNPRAGDRIASPGRDAVAGGVRVGLGILGRIDRRPLRRGHIPSFELCATGMELRRGTGRNRSRPLDRHTNHDNG